MHDLALSIGIVLVVFLLLSLIQYWVMIFSRTLFAMISELSNIFLVIKIVFALILGFLWYVGGFIFYM